MILGACSQLLSYCLLVIMLLNFDVINLGMIAQNTISSR